MLVESYVVPSLVCGRYLRLKRQNQTYFVVCQPSDTFGFLKEQVSLASGMAIKPNQIRLMIPQAAKESKGPKPPMITSSGRSPFKAQPPLIVVEDDSATLEAHDLKNEMELFVVFQISDQEWEEVTVEELLGPTAGAGGTVPDGVGS